MGEGGVFRVDLPLPQHSHAVYPDIRGPEPGSFDTTQVIVTGVEDWPAQRLRWTPAAFLVGPLDTFPAGPVRGMTEWYARTSWGALRARDAAWTVVGPADAVPVRGVNGMAAWHALTSWDAQRARGMRDAPYLNVASTFAPMPAWRLGQFVLAIWQPSAMQPTALRAAAAIYDVPPAPPPSTSLPTRAGRAWAALGFS